MEDSLKDLITIISNAHRPELQILTLYNMLALTGSADGLQLIARQDLINETIALLDNKRATIQKTSALILVNVSAHQNGLELLINSRDDFINILVNNILDPDSEIADSACMILSNVTRSLKYLDKVIGCLKEIEPLLNVFTNNEHNNKGHNLYYMGPVLSNLSQSPDIRRQIFDKTKCTLQKLLPFTEFKDSVIKRGGVVGAIRNCCFDSEYHEWLLSKDIDILPRLLLPLAGNDEFNDEENDKLPCDLQYLPSDKERESDPDIRCMLLEAITQLCSLRKNREFVREQNTYVILRELHKWEKDKKALLACENLVDILIRTEEEIGKDDLKDAQIPEDLVKKFEQMDRDFLEES